MRHTMFKPVLRFSALLLLAGCSTTARYVTTEHWSSGDTFYVGFTEYKETNLVVTKTGESSAHVLLCSAGGDNTAQCRPQVAVDRLLNPHKKYDEPPPPPPAPEEPPAAPAAAEEEAIPNA
jgi:hypothetical protein